MFVLGGVEIRSTSEGVRQGLAVFSPLAVHDYLLVPEQSSAVGFDYCQQLRLLNLRRLALYAVGTILDIFPSCGAAKQLNLAPDELHPFQKAGHIRRRQGHRQHDYLHFGLVQSTQLLQTRPEFGLIV